MSGALARSLELAANKGASEWKVHNLNEKPAMPFYETGAFDVVTCSLSADYLTSPREAGRRRARAARVACDCVLFGSGGQAAGRADTSPQSPVGGARVGASSPRAANCPSSNIAARSNRTAAAARRFTLTNDHTTPP